VAFCFTFTFLIGINSCLYFIYVVVGVLGHPGNESPYQSAAKSALADTSITGGYGLILSEPLDAQEKSWMNKAIKASAADRNTFRNTLSSADQTKFDAMRERMVGGLEKMAAYEAFTGYTFLTWGDFDPRQRETQRVQPRFHQPKHRPRARGGGNAVVTNHLE
jgi:hypothetical protein